MTHSFTIKCDDEISSVLKAVEAEIAKHGGTFGGTAEKGFFEGDSFLGLIKGEYSCVSGTGITITITAKPLLVPHSLIEYEIRKCLG